MMDNDFTGGSFTIQGNTTRYKELGGGSRSGGAGAPALETAGSLSTGESTVNRNIKPRPDKLADRRVPQKILQARRACLSACLSALDRIASLKDDPISKSNCLAEVKQQLELLWNDVEGDADSEAFEEIINVLQIAVFDDDPNSLSDSQLEVLRLVLWKLHEDPDVDDDLANDMTQELITGGIDVFREIG
jgi:hypothetical protein